MRATGCPALLAVWLVLAPAPAGAQGARHPLGRDTATWAGVSGQARVRAESWAGFGAGAPAGAIHDDAFGLSRLLLRGEVHLRGAFALVTEIKSSVAVGRELAGGRRTVDEDVLDVQQLFGEARTAIGAATVTARAGRFDLALGRERLVSPLDWTNSRRTFQGAMARVRLRDLDAVAFWTHPVSIRRRQPNEADSSRRLYGAQLARARAGLAAEAYWLRTESQVAAFNGTVGIERRHTLGARVARAPGAGRIDGDIELAGQVGSIGGAPVRAWMVASQVGRTLGGALSPRIYVGLDAASGDHAAGGSVNTFNQLFPLSHAYLGYADVHGRQNIVAVNAGVTVTLPRAWSVQVDAHEFRRADRNDALYGADGGVSRPAGSGLAARVGAELDLTVRRSLVHGRVKLQGGASRYFAGPFLRQSGPGQDITWVYGQTTVTF